MAFDQPAPSAAPIPVASLAGLGSLDATVTITVDGTVDGKPTQGDLTAALTTNDEGRSKVEVTGSLLGDVVAQVGGSALNLFRPDRLSLYAVPEGTYAVLSSLLDMCVVPEDATTAGALDQLSPQRLLTTLTSGDVARGTFLGDETLNGMAVKHYLIDGDTFLTAARASSDPDLSAFAASLRSVSDADLYVAADTGYPVAYRGGFSGTFEPLSFDGDLTVSAELTSVGANTPVTLPGACDHPISR
ncbi:MAG: hypothetical protein ABWZ82_11490 [Candidatus Limnocylindrales bacterium]